MAGPAIRCLELGRALARTGRTGPVTVASLTAATLADPGVEVVAAADAAVLRKLVARVGSVVVQGDVLGLHPWLADVDVPLVVDAYDPFHLEQLEQGRELGEARRRAVVRDAVRALAVQLSRADLVLCASERQRAMWIGHLAALGRVNPVVYDASPDLSALVAVVPFGAPDTPARPGDRTAVAAAIPNLAPGDRIVLWGGGIYDWFDPGTVIRAVGRLAADRPDLKLLFLGTRHPAQGGVGAATAGRARALAGDLGLLGTVVHFHDGWVPHGDRDRWMSAATVAVSAHLRHLETEFSYRTRVVDYLAAGLPVVTTDVGGAREAVSEGKTGYVVPPRNADAMADRILRLLANPREREAMGALGRQIAWEKFSCAAQLASVEQLYEELFAAAPLGRGNRASERPRRTPAAYQQMPR